MKISYREKYDDKSNQFSNMEMFLPALNKLRKFKQMIEKNQSLITKRTNQEDQAKLLGQDRILNEKRGIFNPQILDAVVFSNELFHDEKEKLEVAERKALTNLIIFV